MVWQITERRDLAADLSHDLLERLPVLPALDCLHDRPDQLNVVLVEDAGLVQRDRRVERGLTAKGGQQGVRALLGDDRSTIVRGDRLDVGGVRKLRIGHDGCRVAVHQDDPQALLRSTRQA